MWHSRAAAGRRFIPYPILSSEELHSKYCRCALIKRLAADLCSRREKWTRAELSERLKEEFNIEASGDEVSEMVYLAYKSSGDDDNIRSAFRTNSYNVSIVEDYEIDSQVDDADYKSAAQTARKELEATAVLIRRLENKLARLESRVGDAERTEKCLRDMDAGKSAEASRVLQALLEDYISVVDDYRNVENHVRDNIADFTTLQAGFVQTCREYEMRLVDIYGKSIISEAPGVFDLNGPLFDLKGEHFLNIDKLFPHADLKDNHIFDGCQSLVVYVSPVVGYQQAMGAAGGRKSVEVREIAKKLATAEVEVGRKQGANAGAEERKNDLERLQTSILDDVGKVKEDLRVRLSVYHNNLKIAILPKAEEFIERRRKVLCPELKKEVLDPVYDDGEISPLDKEPGHFARLEG